MGAAAPARVRVSENTGLLDLAVEAALMAGGMLLERVGHGAELEITSKSTPTDLVSEADTASEQAIRELLVKRRPADGFLGEEGAGAEGSSGLTWVVDPLDGTVNFLFGIPHWCVSVAVRDERGTLAGAVYDPNRDELFTAHRDGPAKCLGPEGTVELSLDAAAGAAAGQGGDLATAMVATGLAYDAEVRAAQAAVLAELAPRVRDIRRFGSAALDLTWTAMGRYDAYFERTVKPWDIAAGALVCERAGLIVRELSAEANLPWGILVAPPVLIDQVAEIVG